MERKYYCTYLLKNSDTVSSNNYYGISFLSTSCNISRNTVRIRNEYFQNTLPHVWVNTDEVWIGNWIYWTLTDRSQLQVTLVLSLTHTLYNSLQHTLRLLSMLYLHRFSPSHGFQHHSFLSFRVHILTGRWMPHNQLNSRLVLLITTRHGSHREQHFKQFFYCCSTQLSHRLHREHHFPVSPLMHVRNLLPNNGRCLQSHSLAMGQHAIIT
jgi:hypothetical protein